MARGDVSADKQPQPSALGQAQQMQVPRVCQEDSAPTRTATPQGTDHHVMVCKMRKYWG